MTAHQGQPLTAELAPVVLLLVAKAREGQLVVCAGAGLSRAADADLPSGERLGELLDQRLSDRVAGYEAPASTGDLLAVADAAVDVIGLLPLQYEVLELADFVGATPNFGHRALALLLAEGAVSTVLLWNWDDCVERAAPGGERVQVARTLEDMQQLQVPSVAKIHGCATRVKTLLITSSQLESPPLWTQAAFTAELRSATGLFIGIGDVADYAKKRIEQLTRDIPELEVYVASPSIATEWDETEWSDLLPELPNEQKIALSADELLDQLARAWARELLDNVRGLAEALTGAHAVGVETVTGAIQALCGPDAIAWLRSAAFRQRFGESVVQSPEAQQAVIALGVLAGEADGDATLFVDGRCQIADRSYEVVIVRDAAPASQVRVEAYRRAEELAGRGLVAGAATFVVAGTVVGPLDQPNAPDVAEGEVEESDVFAGPRATTVSFVSGPELAARAA
jgi:hypothetical protein